MLPCGCCSDRKHFSFCCSAFSFLWACIRSARDGFRNIIFHSMTHRKHTYYGPMNTVAFNVGFHNEHHDFPSIPWNKLPQLKRQAPSYYDSLLSHQSWTKLFFRFLFDKNISLYSRITRYERGKVKLTDESKPDMDLVKEKVA